jgi:hypothetical protein
MLVVVAVVYIRDRIHIRREQEDIVIRQQIR